MKVSNLTEQLSLVTNEDDAQYALEELMSKWKDEGVGLEAVDPILSFMEVTPHGILACQAPLLIF